MTPEEREKEIRRVHAGTHGSVSYLLAALDECRREQLESEDELATELAETRTDPFLRFKDSIEQTLLYVSNNVGSGDHVDQIQAEVDGLLARLGVK